MYLWVSFHKCSGCSLLAGLLCRDSCSSPFFVFQLRSDWHRKRNETNVWYDLPRGGKWFSSYWNSINRPKRVKFHKIKRVLPCLGFLAQHVVRIYKKTIVVSTRTISLHLQKKVGKLHIFPRTVIFLYDLFTFQCIRMETTTCCWHINDRLITRGQNGGLNLLLTGSPLPSSFSSSLFCPFYSAFSSSNPWLEILFTDQQKAIRVPVVSYRFWKDSWAKHFV